MLRPSHSSRYIWLTVDTLEDDNDNHDGDHNNDDDNDSNTHCSGDDDDDGNVAVENEAYDTLYDELTSTQTIDPMEFEPTFSNRDRTTNRGIQSKSSSRRVNVKQSVSFIQMENQNRQVDVDIESVVDGWRGNEFDPIDII
jgi:hypothetical protein